MPSETTAYWKFRRKERISIHKSPPSPHESQPCQNQSKNIMTPQLSRISDFNRKRPAPFQPPPPPSPLPKFFHTSQVLKLINKDRCLKIKRYYGSQRETTFIHYSRTSVARTLMTRLPRLFRTRFLSPYEKIP